MKPFKTFLSILIALTFLLSACGAPASPTAAPQGEATQPPVVETAAPPAEPEGPVSGGTVIIGTPQEPQILNTLLTGASIEDAVTSLFIEGLVQVNEKGEYVPVLAKDLPEVSEDGLVVTYHLKEGVKWADGTEFTCEDVVFTYNGVMSDLSTVSTAGYRKIDTIECPDPYTVVVTFDDVYASYLRMFSYIVPHTAGDIDQMDTWEYNHKPFGTGPFVLDEWVAGDHITFVRNPNFREPGKPYLDSVIIKVLPSREAGMQLLKTGEIHALWDLTEADFPALDQMAADGVAYVSVPNGDIEQLVLNFGANDGSAPADPAANPHPILYDLRVRQAIQYAIDKQKIVDTLLYGKVQPGTSVLSYGLFKCDQPVSEYNPEKAKALLDEAGWKVGADGIRAKDGVRMSLKIATTTGNMLREQTEQVLVEMLKAVGIELVIENVPSDVLFAGWESDGMRDKGKFDIVMYTTGPYIFAPDSHLDSNYHKDSIPTEENEGSGANFSRYINDDVSAWIDESFSTTDIEKRHELYCKAAAQINQDIPRIYLYDRLSITAHRVEFHNLKISPSFVDFAWSSQDWWLQP